MWAAACGQLPTSCGRITAPAGGHNGPSHVSSAFVVEQHTAGSQSRTICNNSRKAIEPSKIQLERLFHLNDIVALEVWPLSCTSAAWEGAATASNRITKLRSE
jgi:hypothetical protein